MKQTFIQGDLDPEVRPQGRYLAAASCALLVLPPLALAIAIGLGACTGSDSLSGAGGGSGGGSGSGGSGGAPDGSSSAQGGSPVELPDASVIHCTLDNGTDPVGLCAQKLVLVAAHEAAFTVAKGVFASWDAKTFAPDTGADGKPLHDPRDDARYAAALARYLASAGRYGDTDATPLLDADLIALAPVIEKELAPLPSTYDGELYRDLRVAAGGLRILNHGADGDALDGLADAYGQAIYTAHYQKLGPSDGVLGDAQGGAVAYAPADVATGALALADLALRHNADDPASAAAWQGAAVAALGHLWTRARHPMLGLFYTALTTSADPDHDAPAGAPDDPLLTDVQATAALALLRGGELALANPGALAALGAYPFEANAEALLAALDGPGAALWDAQGGGYLEGVTPSSGALLPRKTTRANALLFGAVRRAALGGQGPATRIKPLLALLAARTPEHASLLSVVPDQNGYFLRVPTGFDFDAANVGDAGAEPQQRSYRSSALSIAIEGLTEGWYGLPD